MTTTQPLDVNPDLATLRAVLDERLRQHDLWGEQNHPSGTALDVMSVYILEPDELRRKVHRAVDEGNLTYALILLEEVSEAVYEPDPVKLEEELIQVAAVAVAWVGALRRAHPIIFKPRRETLHERKHGRDAALGAILDVLGLATLDDIPRDDTAAAEKGGRIARTAIASKRYEAVAEQEAAWSAALKVVTAERDAYAERVARLEAALADRDRRSLRGRLSRLIRGQ